MNISGLNSSPKRPRPSTGAGVGRPADRLLEVAIFARRMDVLRRLLAAGASTELEDVTGRTPLLQSVAGGHLEMSKILLEAGADPAAVDGVGQGALHLSATASHRELFMLFLDLGLDPSLKNKHGDTPADIFALAGDDQMEKLARTHAARADASHAIRDRATVGVARRRRRL